jgi:hypothetical protein
MLQGFLIVAADPMIESLVAELVKFAGHVVRHVRADETGAAALRREPPLGVLIDASHSTAYVDAVVQAAAEKHVVVVFFASSMSSGELRGFAEQRHAPWFALPNGPMVVGRVLKQAVNGVESFEPRAGPWL